MGCCARLPSARPFRTNLIVNAQKYIRLLDRSGLGGALPVSLDGPTAAEVERALTGYARSCGTESRSLPVIKSIREWRPDYDAPAERGDYQARDRRNTFGRPGPAEDLARSTPRWHVRLCDPQRPCSTAIRRSGPEGELELAESPIWLHIARSS